MNFQMKKLGLCVMLAGFASVVLPAEAATKLENVKVNNALANQTNLISLVAHLHVPTSLLS